MKSRSAKKPLRKQFHCRLPVPVVDHIKATAKQNFLSESGVITDWARRDMEKAKP